MNLLGHIIAMDVAEQVEISGFIPVTHDREPVEQRNIVLLATTRILSRYGGAEIIVSVRGLYCRLTITTSAPAFCNATTPSSTAPRKSSGIYRSHGIHGSSLPDDQSRPFCFHQLNEAGGDILGGLPDPVFLRTINRDRRQASFSAPAAGRDRRCLREGMVESGCPPPTLRRAPVLTVSQPWRALRVTDRRDLAGLGILARANRHRNGRRSVSQQIQNGTSYAPHRHVGIAAMALVSTRFCRQRWACTTRSATPFPT
jgi:hypothetical protein